MALEPPHRIIHDPPGEPALRPSGRRQTPPRPTSYGESALGPEGLRDFHIGSHRPAGKTAPRQRRPERPPVDMALADPDGLGLIAPYMEPEPQVLEVQLDDVAAGNVDPSLGLAEDDVADIEIEPHERGIERIDIARAIE